MTTEERVFGIASKQLDFVMAFFPRVDAKASAVLGINIAMLGFLAANAPQLTSWSWWMAIAALPAALLAVSMRYIYVCSFPRLEGGHRSLIYFREISKRSEHEYILEFMTQEEEQRLKDSLSQIWRNSQILQRKFDALKLAHIWLIAALAPWLVTLFLFIAVNNNQGGLFR